MAQKARSTSPSNFLTELVFEDPEASTIDIVKHSIFEKEGIPSTQRRLSFPLSPSKRGPVWESIGEQIRNNLDDWKAILYSNGKAVGRLVHPLFEATSPDDNTDLQSFQFTFHSFHPAKQSSPRPLDLPLDSEFRKTQFQIQLFGSFGASIFALPFKYKFAGREAAASLSIQLQRLHYISRHQTLRKQTPQNQQSAVPINCGSGIESCIAVFEIEGNLEDLKEAFSAPKGVLLKSFILSFIILNPKSILTKTQNPEMEAILAKNSAPMETTGLDFGSFKKDNPAGVHKSASYTNRKKKTKKKTKTGSKIQDPVDHRSLPGLQQEDSVDRERPGKIPVVEEILKSIDQKQLEASEEEESHQDSTSSPGLDLLEDPYIEGGKTVRPFVIDLNDFDEEDVYIRKNRSHVSLTGSGQDPVSKSQQSCAQNQPMGKTGFQKEAQKCNFGRINFQCANGMLHGNGGGQMSIQRDPVFDLGTTGSLNFTPEQYCFLQRIAPVFQSHPGMISDPQGPHPMIHGAPGGLDFRQRARHEVFDHSTCFYFRSSNDLDSFMTQVTPLLKLDASLEASDAMDKLTLSDLWNFYYESSMIGHQIPLQHQPNGPPKEASSAFYLPYLSGMQLFVPQNDQASSEGFLCDVEGWPTHMHKRYEHFEVNPPWFRKPMYDLMDEVCQEDPELKTMKLKDLHPASWFCVAWYPLYRIPDAPLITRFLTFHSFHPPLYESSMVHRGGSVPLPVLGVEWYNMEDEVWISNIKTMKGSRSSSPSKSTDTNSFINENEVENGEQLHWLYRIRELRYTAKLFARGLSFRRYSRHGPMEVKTHHHDFEYFYERN